MLFDSMVIPVFRFQAGYTKLEKKIPKNQHTKRKLLNFANWFSGEVSKLGHHFKK